MPTLTVTVLGAGVMGDLGQPRLLVDAGQSPHTYALKPSEAQALEAADLVVWVGPVLEPFLQRPVGNIAQESASFRLMRVDGLSVLRTRAGGAWDGHDHGDGHGEAAHAEDAGSEHAPSNHEHESDEHESDEHESDEHESDEHGHDDHGHDDHAHEAGASGGAIQGIPEIELDPHVWLDPDNARLLVRAIAVRLAEIDPANAPAYRANADAMVARIREVESEVADVVGPVADVPYVVFHDAYQYFERHYGLNAVGSITLSPDRQPGARRLLEIRDKIAELDARCVFREPQFAPDLVRTVIEDTTAQVGTLDPLGIAHAAGPDAYPQLLRELGRNLAGCPGGAG